MKKIKNIVDFNVYKLTNDDRIPIYTKEFNGDDSLVWYAIADSNVGVVNLKCHFAIDEDDSACLLEDIFERYFDDRWNRDSDMPTDTFNHWGNNFYPLDIVEKILAELEECMMLLENNPYNPKLQEIIDLNHAIKAYRNISLRICLDEKIPLEEKMEYMIPKKDVLIDFYSRFINYTKKMICENPQAKFFVVSGP